MQISEQELREMIRNAVARHMGSGQPRESQAALSEAGSVRVHASHGLFVVAGSTDGECVIEPGHRCDHCGYCKSLGH